MQASPLSPKAFRFGLFEADLVTGELRKRGTKIPIQDQPFRVLTLLLRRSGELVTRREFQQTLWPAGTYVEFDEGLDKAIQKLRGALDDSSGNPRFIETVHRKGYRFIAPVERLDGEAPAATCPPHLVVESAVSPPATAVVKRQMNGVLAWAAFGIVSFALVVFGAVHFRILQPASRPAPKTVPLTSYPGVQGNPALSPDGKQVAFSWNGEKGDNFDIYVKLVDGGEPIRLTSSPGPKDYPAWSPDGLYVAFCRRFANTRSGDQIRHLRGRSEIWRIHALGGAEQKLAETTTSEGLSWSPDGRFLALVDQPEPEAPPSIFLLNVETREKRQLTSPPKEYVGDFNPKFSPDGKALGFRRDFSAVSSDLYILSISNGGRGEPRRLTFDGLPADFDWTADGRSIVYSTERYLFTVPAAGGKAERLAIEGENTGGLSISRAGNRLVCERYAADWNIWRIPGPNSSDPGGTATRFIASTELDLNSRFSPDGSRIVFVSNRSGDHELWVCDREGRNPTQLTSVRGPSVGSARWSPDSRWIAFDSSGGNNSDIYVISAEGGPMRRVTTGPSNNVRPSWSGDARWIYFGSNRNGDWQIWKAPAQGGGAALDPIPKGGNEAFESPDGKSIYYARLDARGIFKAPAGGGEETRVLEQGGVGIWNMFDQGICFLDDTQFPTLILKFYNFATRKVTILRQFPKGTRIDRADNALTVSPDGRWILYDQLDLEAVNLKLVENFQ